MLYIVNEFGRHKPILLFWSLLLSLTLRLRHCGGGGGGQLVHFATPFFWDQGFSVLALTGLIRSM